MEKTEGHSVGINYSSVFDLSHLSPSPYQSKNKMGRICMIPAACPWLSDRCVSYFIKGKNAVQIQEQVKMWSLDALRQQPQTNKCQVSSLPRWVEPHGQSSAWWTWWSPETRARTQLGWNGHCGTSWGTFLQQWLVLKWIRHENIAINSPNLLKHKVNTWIIREY